MKRRAVALLGAGVLALAACGSDTGGGSSDGGGDGTGAVEAPASDRTEVGALTPRIVLAHEGGVVTLDSADGAVLERDAAINLKTCSNRPRAIAAKT